jgi:glycyl-tRNA synthetase beta subunit
MSKPKRETVSEMRRRMADVITRMEKEKAEIEAAMQKERVRISGIIAEVLASKDDVIDCLGNCSNAELKRIAAVIAGKVPEIKATYDREQMEKDRARELAEKGITQPAYASVQAPEQHQSEGYNG